ncbi:MAG: radical SAM protein [Phycisphaerae bacterium]
MKVLLIRSPQVFARGGHVAVHADVPLALMYLGAAAERAGHEAVIYDAATQAEPGPLECDALGRLHVGEPWDEVARAIEAAAPDVIGITSLFYTQMPQALETARMARRVCPEVPIVMGGAPVTVRPEDYLAEPAVSMALVAEGDAALPLLLDALAGGDDLAGVPNLVYRTGGRLQRHPVASFVEDLDTLAGPAYHLVDLSRYMRALSQDPAGRWRWKPRRIMTVQTSRGCPFGCTYCAVRLHMGRTYRVQSPERVLAHLRFIATDLGIRHIHFIDDNLGQNQERFHAILDGLIAMKREGLPMVWDTPIGMRTDRLTYDILAKAREAGCRSMYLTVESGSQRVLDRVIRKGLKLEKVLQAADACKRLGIKARAGFIMGLPGETIEDMQMTIDMARHLKRRYGIRGHVSMATPLYGTPLYDICEREGYLKQEMTPEAVARSFAEGGMIETEDWSVADLRTMRDAFERQDGWLHQVVRSARRRLRRLGRN